MNIIYSLEGEKPENRKKKENWLQLITLHCKKVHFLIALVSEHG